MSPSINVARLLNIGELSAQARWGAPDPATERGSDDVLPGRHSLLLPALVEFGFGYSLVPFLRTE